MPDPPEMEDPFPDIPSLFDDMPIGYVAAPVDGPGSIAPAAGASNVVTKLMPFPMRIPFHPAYSGKNAPKTTRVCDPNNATQLIIPESKKNTVEFSNTCPWTRTATVTVGLHPAGIAATPDGALALVANYGDGTNPGSISMINIATHALAKTLSFQLAPDGFPVQPNRIAILPDGSRAYVTSHACNPGSFVFIIDMSTFAVIGNIPVGCFPAAMAVTPDGSQLWVTQRGDSRMDAFDTATNALVASFNVPLATGVAFDPAGKTAYVGEGLSPGFIDVIDTSSYQRTAQIPVGSLPFNVLVTPSGHDVFVTNGLSNSISQISTVGNTVVRTILMPNNSKHPSGLAFIH
jgi:YVTN family beta-propeller protein